MKIIRADKMGFCAGVRRAVNLAEKALEKNSGGQVYTLGPLIHNPAALKKLADRNLKILDESHFDELAEGDTVLIRAHGVPPEKEAELKSKKVDIINATCPLVTQSQKRAAKYAAENYVIFFAGDKNHGEVVGIEGYAREAAEKNGLDFRFILIKNVGETEREIENLLEKIPDIKNQKVALLSQTTFSISEFAKIESLLKEKLPQTEVVNSICPATHERQDSLVELCAQVDGVLVIGGKSSANTNRLFATAQKLCKKAALIENAGEIPEVFFHLEKVGLTAGASTPDDVILEVELKLKG